MREREPYTVGPPFEWPPRPGRKFYDYARSTHDMVRGRTLCRVVAIAEDHVVFKWHSPRRGWTYSIEHWLWFQSRGLVAEGHECKVGGEE